MAFNSSTGYITIPQSGYYQISISFYVSASGSAYIITASPFFYLVPITTGSYNYATGSYFGYFNAGTNLLLYLTNLSPSNPGAYYPNGYWSIYKAFS